MATSDKYDRQLRLWGAVGQRLLAHAHVLLVNADASGSETLKNLVLPGVGRITVLDDTLVTQADLGVNFFVDEERLGKPRAEVVVALLTEMNPDCQGFFRHNHCHSTCGGTGTTPGTTAGSSLQAILDHEPEYFASFSAVIASNLPESSLLPVAARCWALGVPLIAVQSYGLVGSLRLQYRDHTVMESKPSNQRWDLRVNDPFPELAAYADSFDLAQLDEREFTHVPYIVILYKAMQQWRAEHGSLPSTDNQKDAFRALIHSMSESHPTAKAGGLNFAEAVRESYRAYAAPALPDEVAQLLDEERSAGLDSLRVGSGNSNSNCNSSSTDFRLLCHALIRFMDTHEQRWPLSGALPDMTSLTHYFVQLQEAYQRRAASDRAEMRALLNAIESETGRLTVNANDGNAHRSQISNDALHAFCAHVMYLGRYSTRSLAEERESPAMDELSAALADPFEDPQQTPALWYLSLRAAHAFHSQHGRWPGADSQGRLYADPQAEAGSEAAGQVSLPLSYNDDVDAVWALLQETAATHLYEVETPETAATSGAPHVSRAHAAEMVRFGGAELHVTASLVGGLASQEAVKLLVKQYIPANNTYIFNGICGCGARYEL